MIRDLVPWAKAWAPTVRKRVHFCITTNGTLLTDEVIDFLVQWQFSIMISLDGPQPVQDAFRPTAGGKGSFEIAAPRIKRLLERHPGRAGIIVRTTMTHQSHDLIALSKFFEEFGFARAGLGSTIGYAFHKGKFDITSDDREDMESAIESMLDDRLLPAIRSYRRVPYNPVVASLVALNDDKERGGAKVKLSCGAGRNDEGIDVDGKVYPCHRYVGMSAYVVGDVVNGVDAKALESYYRRLLSVYSACTTCWASRWCAGCCPRYLSRPDGEISAPDAEQCEWTRRYVHRNLALHAELDEAGIDWEKVRNEVAN